MLKSTHLQLAADQEVHFFISSSSYRKTLYGISYGRYSFHGYYKLTFSFWKGPNTLCMHHRTTRSTMCWRTVKVCPSFSFVFLLSLTDFTNQKHFFTYCCFKIQNWKLVHRRTLGQLVTLHLFPRKREGWMLWLSLLHPLYSFWDSSPWNDLLTMKSISLVKVIPHRHFQRQTQFIPYEYVKIIFKISAYPYILTIKHTLQEIVVYFSFWVNVWTDWISIFPKALVKQIAKSCICIFLSNTGSFNL